MVQKSQGQPPKGCRKPCQQWDNRLTYQHQLVLHVGFLNESPQEATRLEAMRVAVATARSQHPSCRGLVIRVGVGMKFENHPQKNLQDVYFVKIHQGIIYNMDMIKIQSLFFFKQQGIFPYFLVYQRRFLESWTGTTGVFFLGFCNDHSLN